MERWLPVVGYEGWYEVSDHGRVRRIKAGSNAIIGRVMVGGLTSCGYRHVLLYKNGVRQTRTIHILVMLAFVGPRPYGMDIDHIDTNKDNNKLSNLEYVTKVENRLRSYRNGRQNAKGEASGCATVSDSVARKIKPLLLAAHNNPARKRGDMTKLYNKLYKKYGVTEPTCRHMLHGDSYRWL